MKRRKHARLALDPGYGEAISAQASRLGDVRSILDCVKYTLINCDEDEIDVTGAVIVAHEMLDSIIGALDSVSLRAAAEKWRAGRQKE